MAESQHATVCVVLARESTGAHGGDAKEPPCEASPLGFVCPTVIHRNSGACQRGLARGGKQGGEVLNWKQNCIEAPSVICPNPFEWVGNFVRILERRPPVIHRNSGDPIFFLHSLRGAACFIAPGCGHGAGRWHKHVQAMLGPQRSSDGVRRSHGRRLGETQILGIAGQIPRSSPHILYQHMLLYVLCWPGKALELTAEMQRSLPVRPRSLTFARGLPVRPRSLTFARGLPVRPRGLTFARSQRCKEKS